MFFEKKFVPKEYLSQSFGAFLRAYNGREKSSTMSIAGLLNKFKIFCLVENEFEKIKEFPYEKSAKNALLDFRYDLYCEKFESKDISTWVEEKEKILKSPGVLLNQLYEKCWEICKNEYDLHMLETSIGVHESRKKIVDEIVFVFANYYQVMIKHIEMASDILSQKQKIFLINTHYMKILGIESNQSLLEETTIEEYVKKLNDFIFEKLKMSHPEYSPLSALFKDAGDLSYIKENKDSLLVKIIEKSEEIEIQKEKSRIASWQSRKTIGKT